jgi:hypothetical protein
VASRKPNRSAPGKKAATVSAVERAQTAANQAAFVEQFIASGTITGACRGSGVGRTTHYDWLRKDKQYAERFKQAEVEAVDVCETEARRRAIIGVEEPVFYQGRIVGSVRKHSDTLLMFILNGRRSEVFRQRFEHTGKDNGPIQTQHVPVDPKDLSDDELAVMVRVLERQAAKNKPHD